MVGTRPMREQPAGGRVKEKVPEVVGTNFANFAPIARRAPSALLHAEMQVWLALIRRLAAKVPVIVAARGQAVPGRPAPGGVCALR